MFALEILIVTLKSIRNRKQAIMNNCRTRQTADERQQKLTLQNYPRTRNTLARKVILSNIMAFPS